MPNFVHCEYCLALKGFLSIVFLIANSKGEESTSFR